MEQGLKERAQYQIQGDWTVLKRFSDRIRDNLKYKLMNLLLTSKTTRNCY